MSSTGIVRRLVWLSGTLLMIDGVFGVPVPSREEKEIVLMPLPVPPTRFVQVPVAFNPYPAPFPIDQQSATHQTRGPFDFIGQWIQQTPWLPVEVNVPDVFQNIGNGISQAGSNIQQFSQNVGNGVTQFTQNVGSGFNQFTQNVGNGWNQWMQQLGQRWPFLGNVGGNTPPQGHGGQQLLVMMPVKYPEGQQLIMDEAIEAFP